jgi:hypothetical protein
MDTLTLILVGVKGQCGLDTSIHEFNHPFSSYNDVINTRWSERVMCTSIHEFNYPFSSYNDVVTSFSIF